MVRDMLLANQNAYDANNHQWHGAHGIDVYEHIRASAWAGRLSASNKISL